MWSINSNNYSKILVLDTEETIHEKGDPFSSRNLLVCITWVQVNGTNRDEGIWWIEHDQLEDGQRADLGEVRRIVAEADLLVGFNIKRDLLWLRRYGLWDPYGGQDLFDCQIAEFLCSSQSLKYPALDECLGRRGISVKPSPVHELWKSGVDTNRIDIDDLTSYAMEDARGTETLYRMCRETISQRSEHFQTLVGLEMEDLKFIMEMEWNGVKFELEAMRTEGEKLQQEIEAAENEIRELVGGVPVNLGSPDHRSAILFGGKITESWKEQVGVYKTGKHVGEPRYKWCHRVHEFPRLARPKRKLKKDGLFATDYDTLASLRITGKARKVRDAILLIADLSKLRGTYLEGIPKKAEEMGWTDGIVHGHYNQTSVVTGRLSSEKPNMQNLDPRVSKYIVSRYAD